MQRRNYPVITRRASTKPTATLLIENVGPSDLRLVCFCPCGQHRVPQRERCTHSTNAGWALFLRRASARHSYLGSRCLCVIPLSSRANPHTRMSEGSAVAFGPVCTHYSRNCVSFWKCRARAWISRRVTWRMRSSPKRSTAKLPMTDPYTIARRSTASFMLEAVAR